MSQETYLTTICVLYIVATGRAPCQQKRTETKKTFLCPEFISSQPDIVLRSR